MDRFLPHHLQSQLEFMHRIAEAERQNESPATGPRPEYFVGLDLGQSADYTALAILERHGGNSTAATFHARYLRRYQLGTKYPAIVSDVSQLLTRAPLLSDPVSGSYPVLAVDATGVGAGVVDMFREAPLAATLRPVMITGGDKVTEDGDVTRVPKRDLVGEVQSALQTGRLKIAPGLDEAQTLVRELQNFQVKISLETAHDSYGAWREGTHDDLVLAVALALWMGRNTGPGIFF